MARGQRKVGGLVAELLMRDKDFRAKLNRAARLVRRRTQEMRRAFNNVAKRMAKIGAVAAGIMTAGIVRAMQSIDKLAKTSDKLNIPTQSLQVMQEAAKLTGVEVQSLEMGVQRMVRRVSEAARGTGEAVDAIKELGLEAKALNELSPDEQMEMFAAAMAKVPRQSDRVRLAMKLFDSEGVALVNTLALGSEGFQEIRDEIERYGLAVSRIDAAKVEQSTDSFTKLRRITKGFFEQMAIQVAPIVSEVGERILDNADAMGGMGKVSERVMNGMVTAGGAVADVFWGWKMAIAAAQEGIMRLASMMARTSRELGVFDAIAQFQEGAQVIARDVTIREQAIKQLEKEGAINERGPLGLRVSFSSIFGKSEDELIQERIKELQGALPDVERVEPIFSDSFLQDLERELNKGADELGGKLGGIVDEGKPSDRIKNAFDKVSDKWEKMAEERAAERAAFNSGAVDATRDIDSLGNAAAEAGEAIAAQTAEVQRQRLQGLEAGRRTHAEIMAQGGTGTGRRTHAEIMGRKRMTENTAVESEQVRAEVAQKESQEKGTTVLEEIRNILKTLQQGVGVA